MANYTIFHNPRCSKSRQTLQLLRDNGVEPETRLYLENPPSADELTEILKMLGISAKELLRKGEDEYKALGLKDTSLSDSALIEAMIGHPRLIERPIVIKDGKQAVLGRPPETVLDLVS